MSEAIARCYLMITKKILDAGDNRVIACESSYCPSGLPPRCRRREEKEIFAWII